ncbi:hypothetical protein BSKO_02080 [Bryopsis sp. KO-2023]|nr:hypothetical protein BSKO_02080 [Bryopsis sp. KO-2023]
MNTQFGRAGCSTARPGGAAVPGDFRGDAGQLGQGGNAIVEPRDDDDLMDYTEHSRDAPAQDNIGHPPLGPVARSLAGEGDRIETPVCPDELSTVSVPSGQPNLDEVFPVLPILAKVGHPSPAASAEGSSPHQFQGWYFSCACTQACSAQPSLETSRGSSKYWTVLSTEAPQSDTETDAASPILDDPGYQLCISPDDFQQQPARPFGESDEQDRAMFCGPAPPQEQQEQPNRNNDDCSGDCLFCLHECYA